MTSSPSPVPLGFADQVDAAAALIFPSDSPTAMRIGQHTTSLREDSARLKERGMGDVPTIALVGKVGEGKSWLAQCFLNGDTASAHVREMVRSGQNAGDRTHQLIWLGESAPFSARSHDELFVRVPTSSMLDLGTPYALADSPGYSDHDPTLEALSSVAITSASVKILATSVSQIRDGSLLPFVRSMDGATIVPVVRFRPEGGSAQLPSDDIISDCRREIAQWSEAAPHCHFAAPLFVPDAGVAGQEEAEAIARKELTETLQPILADRAALDDRIDIQLRERLAIARQDIAQTLEPFRQRIGAPVEQLNQLTAEAGASIEDELIGNNDVLRGAVRARFRGDALDRTPILLFPYRSLLGILGLTLGAWDRVIFATMGSVPSLVLSAWQAAKSFKDGKPLNASLRDDLRSKVQESLQDRFADTLRAFAIGLESVAETGTTTPPERHSITLRGLAGLEMKSRTIIDDEIRGHRVNGVVLWLGGIVATAGFWTLMAGPIAGLYSDYLMNLLADLKAGSFSWKAYPTPSASLWLTSLLLSLAPTVVVAMLVMASACGGSRVRRTTKAIRKALGAEIGRRFGEEKLKVEINDPKLEAARKLLGVSSS
ncbi:hypothetical protein [Sulfuriroseicoccus oceanibius]|uniref:Uncharacterized protein n=1 Tax=Sulfuriroseicoccus oceanibius TaxID=2707525 RepID=A0A6B3L603_9BACT|nr:hypothetical protein [Sulfuriroseicoccus oceanibius]QQL45731.1 hypothetical protein G3M56_003850 [Sulfuriroseicoccus oceanibius]